MVGDRARRRPLGALLVLVLALLAGCAELPERMRHVSIGDPFDLDGTLVEGVEPDPLVLEEGTAAVYRHRLDRYFDIVRSPWADDLELHGAEVRLGLSPKITLTSAEPVSTATAFPDVVVVREARAAVSAERSGVEASYAIARNLDLRFERSASCEADSCDYLFDGPMLDVRNALTSTLSIDDGLEAFDVVSRSDGIAHIVVDLELTTWSPRPSDAYHLTFRIVTDGTTIHFTYDSPRGTRGTEEQ